MENHLKERSSTAWLRLSYPIYFTEFWQLSDPRRTISGAHPPGRWSPELQAIEQFYRVASSFSS